MSYETSVYQLFILCPCKIETRGLMNVTKSCRGLLIYQDICSTYHVSVLDLESLHLITTIPALAPSDASAMSSLPPTPIQRKHASHILLAHPHPSKRQNTCRQATVPTRRHVVPRRKWIVAGIRRPHVFRHALDPLRIFWTIDLFNEGEDQI